MDAITYLLSISWKHYAAWFTGLGVVVALCDTQYLLYHPHMLVIHIVFGTLSYLAGWRGLAFDWLYLLGFVTYLVISTGIPISLVPAVLLGTLLESPSVIFGTAAIISRKVLDY